MKRILGFALALQVIMALVTLVLFTSKPSLALTPGGAGNGTYGLVQCIPLSGTSIILTPSVTSNRTIDCYSLVLTGNTTITTFAAAGAPANGWTAQLTVTQAASGGPYTLTLNGGSGVSVNLASTGGCSSLSMPSVASQVLAIDAIFNSNANALEVTACPTFGS